jgi:DNA-binding SARP family transcriptional activator
MTSPTPVHCALFHDGGLPFWEQCEGLIHNRLDAGELVLYIADEAESRLAHHVLVERSGLPVTVINASEAGLRQPQMNTTTVLSGIEARILAALDAGAKRVCLFTEMTWAIRTPSAAVRLAEFETALQALQLRLPVSLCCLYQKAVMLDEHLAIGLHAHPQLWINGEICANPHALPISLLSVANQRQRVEYWLRRLTGAEDESPDSVERPQAAYTRESFAPLWTDDPAHQRWKIRCFGQLRVYRDNGQPVVWDSASGATSKTRTLFAFLLVRGEHGASSEEIADLLWPDASDEKQSLNRLYHTVRCLRVALSPELAASRTSPFIRHAEQRYFLAVPQGTWIDLPMFQEQCHNVSILEHDGQLEQALICGESAERLYSGDLFENIPAKYASNREQDWCWSRRYWFREMFTKLMWTMASIHRRQGTLAKALEACEKALNVDSSCEMAHLEKMRAFSAGGRIDAMHRQFRTLCRALEADGLGAPAPETRALYEHLSGTKRFVKN